MNIEDYILLRKSKENINEHDSSKKLDNIQIFIGYIFDYFNLPDKEVKQNAGTRLIQYQKEIEDYSSEVREWLIDIYMMYKIKINKELGKLLDNNIYFLISNTDKHFEKTSYDIYSKIMSRKKLSFMEDYPLEILNFMKDYHKIKSNHYRSSITKYKLNLSKKEKEKIKSIEEKFNINFIEWIHNYTIILSRHKSLWSFNHIKYTVEDGKEKSFYDYKYSRNLFELITVLGKTDEDISKERKLIEKIMMYFWTKEIADDRDYYREYCKKHK